VRGGRSGSFSQHSAGVDGRPMTGSKEGANRTKNAGLSPRPSGWTVS
jgi:hypothetical protein